MRLRIVVGFVVFFILVAAVLAGIMFGSGLLASRTSFGDSQAPATLSDNPIVLENTHLGTDRWKIPQGKEASTQIQAYASATSVLPGQELTFYVSTQNEGTAYSIEIYRLGWYVGSGGRLMSSMPSQTGQAQGYYNSATQRLVGCYSCYFDPKTGLVEANWQPSYTLAVPSDWTTGIYLAKFIDANGKQTYVPFDVRGTSHSLYVAVTPDTNYAAYNTWGGYSLYERDSSLPVGETIKVPRGVKVSFDRPYTVDNGSSYEWDRVFANGATPKGLQVLGASPTVNDTQRPDTSNTTYYIAPSGAMVFATGSIYWALALDTYRFQTDKLCTGQSPVVPGLQTLMARVMDALVIQHPVPQQTPVPTATTTVSTQLEVALRAIVDSSYSRQRMTTRP